MCNVPLRIAIALCRDISSGEGSEGDLKKQYLSPAGLLKTLLLAAAARKGRLPSACPTVAVFWRAGRDGHLTLPFYIGSAFSFSFSSVSQAESYLCRPVCAQDILFAPLPLTATFSWPHCTFQYENILFKTTVPSIRRLCTLMDRGREIVLYIHLVMPAL